MGERGDGLMGTTRHPAMRTPRTHCKVCGVPTEAMSWHDQFMCDACQNDMAEFFYADRDKVAAWIDQARMSLGEAQDEMRSREP